MGVENPTLVQDMMLITELMLIAVGVAVAVKYIRLPYTVALVLVGLVVGFSNILPSFLLSKEVILFIFLPPLLFEGTLNMDLKLLKSNGLLVGLLALVGTLISTFLLGFIIHWLLDFPFLVSLLIGAIITPTDPVSVLATFKQYGVAKGLSTIVEGESVFNDGIGVVVYLLLIKIISGGDISADGAMSFLTMSASFFLWEVIVGAVVGLVLGYVTHLFLGKIDDNLIEVLISLILAYGSYLLAERLHCSGVVAVVCAGLIMGNYGRVLSMSAKTRVTLSHFWEVIAFAVNSLLFLLIGIDLDSKILIDKFGVIILVFALMLAARSLTVYLLTTITGLVRPKKRVSWAYRHAINWAGLRGSIPIALVLGLPASGAFMRNDMIPIVFGVVFLSLMVQGLTIKPLLKGLKLIDRDQKRLAFERALAWRIVTKAAIRELDEMQESGEISDHFYETLQEKLVSKDQEYSYALALLKQEHDEIRESMNRRIARRLGYAERTSLQQAFIQGVIGDRILEEMVVEIDQDIDIGILAVMHEGETLDDVLDIDQEVAEDSENDG